MKWVYQRLAGILTGYALLLQGQTLSTSDRLTETNRTVSNSDVRVTANIQSERLEVVSQSIASRIQTTIVLEKGIADDVISVHVDAPIEAALREVFAGYDIFVKYGGGSQYQPPVLRGVWVFRKGGASEVSPVRYSECASTIELQAALIDADTNTRETAYGTLLERPDETSRRVMLDVIRGLREADPGLRERVFSNAISRGYPLRPEFLSELVRTDPSEQIRWMALDALSQYPSAGEVAQSVKADSSENVRFRAMQILNQLAK